MKKKTKIYLTRALGYICGLLLFYAPFSIFQRIIFAILGDSASANRASIDSMCLTMSIRSLLTLDFSRRTSVIMIISLVLLIVVALFFGPLYCGKLCPVGALPEYLSKLVPRKFQINLKDKVNPTPVRYGFLLAFIVSPMVGGSLGCMVCGFSMMQRFVNAPWKGIGFMYSTAMLVIIFWLIVGGLFNVGGRGWCNYFCPVGAFQSLLHAVASKLPFTFKLKIDRSKCVSCGQCAQMCPMGSLTMKDGELQHNVCNCMECGACSKICPKEALKYGTGKDGWKAEK